MTAGTRTDPHDATRIDVSWSNGPTIVIKAADGTWHQHRLTLTETTALIRRLACDLENAYRPTHDRTAQSVEASAELGYHTRDDAA